MVVSASLHTIEWIGARLVVALPGLPSLKDFMNAMSAGWPIALAILLGSLALAALHQQQVPYINLLPDLAIAIALVMAIFAGAICLVALAQNLGPWAQRRREERETENIKARRIAKLRLIPMDEEETLSYYFNTNRQIFTAPQGHPKLLPLIHKGFIAPLPGNHNIMAVPHMIPDYIWDEMQKHPERFSQMPARNPLDRGT